VVFMRESLLSLLVDPIEKSVLEAQVDQWNSKGDLMSGFLRGAGGRSYRIVNGIPRFVLTEDDSQIQTKDSFGFKWRQRETYESRRVSTVIRPWLIQRYGFANLEDMREFFASRRLILDAGCGSGFTASLWMNRTWQRGGEVEWVGLDISNAIDVARERLVAIPGTHFIQGDMLQMPFREWAFDTIFSEGALHHTPSTELALKSLVWSLAKGGEILFYVYRKKGPVREFTDDYVRGIVSRMKPEEAWDSIRSLTKLARSLARLRKEVRVSEDIPLLGIKAGRYDIQRFIYWHFAKLYWNEALSFEENNHVNFDWYHPRYAHRQTEEEVRRWCSESGLSITHVDVQKSGFTVRAIRT